MRGPSGPASEWSGSEVCWDAESGDCLAWMSLFGFKVWAVPGAQGHEDRGALGIGNWGIGGIELALKKGSGPGSVGI